MTDRKQTYEQYLSVCDLHKKPVNHLIKTVFENIEQIAPKIKYYYLLRSLILKSYHFF